LVGAEAKLTHDVADKIDTILDVVAPKRKPKGPLGNLKGLFEGRGIRACIAQLLAWTPGKAHADQPNYEYPWPSQAETDVPTGHELFEDEDEQSAWIDCANALSNGAAKTAEAIRRFQV
jgi:hypothetical protein